MHDIIVQKRVDPTQSLAGPIASMQLFDWCTGYNIDIANVLDV